MIRKDSIKKFRGVYVVILLSIIPLLDLLHPGLPITHDGMDHLARIANFYDGLSEGIIVPRWAENLNWGYGHPVLMFLYPFSSYLASFFHLLGFSLVDSVKLVFSLGFIASGLTMYLWAKEQFNEYFAIFASVLYMYAPYRFVDMYVRGAIGEHMAFIFPPLVLYFLMKFFQKQKNEHLYWYLIGITISFAFLLLSHNAISIMFIPLFISYAVILAFNMKNFKKLLLVFGAFLWGSAVSAFFTIPAFFEGKYTLRDIVTGDEYKDRFVDPIRFLVSPWNYGITGQFSVQLGVVHLLGLFSLPFVLLGKIEKRAKLLLLIFTGFFVGSIFLQLSYSNFLYEIVTTLKKFQFPWRFLSLTSFTIAVLSSAIFLILKENYKSIALIFGLVFVVLVSLPFMHAKEYKWVDDTFYKDVYHGTTDTGESAPIWSVRFMEELPNSHIEVLSGEAMISEIARSSTKHTLEIFVTSDTARIKDNTLFFPGWRAYSNNEEKQIEFQDPSNRGLITFNLEKGMNTVEVVFSDTKLRTAANIISLIALLVIPAGFVLIKRK